MAIRSAVVFDVVEQAVRDLENGLVGNVLIGPGESQRLECQRPTSDGPTGFQT